MTPVTATPIALPTCCIVDSAPEAAPARCGSSDAEDGRGQRRDDEAHAGADEQQRRGRARRPSRRSRPRRRSRAAPRARPRARARRAAGSRRPRRAVSSGASSEATRYAAARIVNTSPAWSGVEAAAELQVQREDEEERRLPGPEHELGQQPGAERAVAEQRGVEQRRAAAAAEPALVGGERGRATTGAAARHSHVHSGQPCWRPSTSGSTTAISAERDEDGAGEVDAARALRRATRGRGAGRARARRRRSGR